MKFFRLEKLQSFSVFCSKTDTVQANSFVEVRFVIGTAVMTQVPFQAAFYNGLKSKVGLAAAKAAALRVNLNVQGCGIVAPLPLALPICSPSFFHTISLPPAFTSA